MQITIELPEILGEKIKYLPNFNDFIVKLLSQSLANFRVPQGQEETQNAIEKMKAFRQGNRLNGLTIKGLIEEGRR
jgi:hypothetical protein